MTDTPEQNELVIAVIKKIMPYGAFCILPEYNDREAFLHVSEVAPRWIKNIHEFISEGQRHVVKVYHIDKEKNQVDISLKRVNEEEKKQKIMFSRLEKRAEKLLEISIKESKSSISLPDLKSLLEKKFGSAYSCFESLAEDSKEADDLDVPKALREKLVEIANKNIKKSIMKVSGVMNLTCYGEKGIEIIKKALDIKEDTVEVTYLGAPKYKFTVTAPTYKEGEKKLSEVVEHIKSFVVKNNCELLFEREKGD